MAEIVQCPHCFTQVMLSSDGKCPSCRHKPDEEISKARRLELEAARQRDKSPGRSPRLLMRVIAAACLLLAVSPIITSVQVLASYQAKTTAVYIAYGAGLLSIPAVLVAFGIFLWKSA